jgi:hypothetical protein
MNPNNRQTFLNSVGANAIATFRLHYYQSRKKHLEAKVEESRFFIYFLLDDEVQHAQNVANELQQLLQVTPKNLSLQIAVLLSKDMIDGMEQERHKFRPKNDTKVVTYVDRRNAMNYEVTRASYQEEELYALETKPEKDRLRILSFVHERKPQANAIYNELRRSKETDRNIDKEGTVETLARILVKRLDNILLWMNDPVYLQDWQL